jgi:glycine cleavage system transcriptional repressor
MIYEVDLPLDTDQIAFRHALRQRAEELGLDLSLQHRDVYLAVHRV